MNKLVPKAITFDVYGTILDSHGCWLDWFRSFIERKRITSMSPQEALTRWEAIQFDYSQAQYVPFRQLKRDSFKMACKEFGFDYTDEDVESFTYQLDKCKAFPDSREAIAELRTYTKVVALTNVANEITQETFDREGIVVDRILTSQDAKAYKPKHEAFLYSQKVLGLAVDDLMHAAFGFLYDVVPATALGYRTVWINRLGIIRPADVKETYLCGDLKTLAYIIKGMAMTDAENEAKNGAK